MPSEQIIHAVPRAHKHLEIAKHLTHLLEGQFNLFGYRFGLDAVIGLIPGFGDFITFLMSAYLVIVGLEMRLPWWRIVQMVWHIVLDFLVGSIPVLGDFFDVVHKANTKNLAILEKYHDTV